MQVAPSAGEPEGTDWKTIVLGRNPFVMGPGWDSLPLVELPFDLWHLAFVNLIQRRAPPNFEYLRLFSHRPASPGEATRWLRQWMRDTKMKQPDMEELPGFEELFKKTIEKTLAAMPLEERLAGLAPEERLAGLAPEERLAGLAPEQVLSAFAPEERLAGLTPEQSVLALPLEVLRVLPEEYLRSLPVETQTKVRKRLQEASH